MRDYELMVVMHPTISDEEMPGALDQVAGYIMSRGGTIQEYQLEAPWGRRRLAYPINDQTEGFYTLFRYQAEPGVATEIDRELRLNENVLRFLVTRPQAEKPEDVEQEETQQEEVEVAVSG